MGTKKLQYIKNQENGFYVCCPICKFVHIIIGDKRINIDIKID